MWKENEQEGGGEEIFYCSLYRFIVGKERAGRQVRVLLPRSLLINSPSRPSYPNANGAHRHNTPSRGKRN